ncbi:MAG: ATP-binding protein [Actinomycetota bacterium]|nr:ATP-binding protein [Actinomycetota bacterium]
MGVPGSGKTMLARRLPGILPRMSLEESLEVTRIYSVAGLLGERASLIQTRPFRAPHQGVSIAGLIGGGTGVARPGEISLAHFGVLFMDELTLFKRDVLESLRGPVEEGVVRIARSGGVVSYPSRFSLIAAMNPCPCGYLGDDKRRCECGYLEIQRYLARLSGPLLDRFDVFCDVGRLGKDELLGPPDGATSSEMRKVVESARAIQTERYGSGGRTNATASRSEVLAAGGMADNAWRLLGHGVEEGTLSGRGVDRAIRVARTIADLREGDGISEEDMGAALSMRFLQRDHGQAA